MPTLKQYRHAALKALGDENFHTSTATSGSTTAVLEDTAWPIKSDIASSKLYKDKFLLRPSASASADKVRLVKTYTPASGYLYPDRVWTNAPSNGEAYELSGLIEPWTELNDLINEVLKMCFVVDEFTVVPTQDHRRHCLTTWAPWLTDENWVRSIGWLAKNENRTETDVFKDSRIVRGRVVKHGEEIWIEHPDYTFQNDEVLYVKAIKPAYWHCASAYSAHYTYSAATISFDTDNRTLADSATGLGDFDVEGMQIRVSGSDKNDGIYTVTATCSTSSLTLREPVVDESAGETIRISRVEHLGRHVRSAAVQFDGTNEALLGDCLVPYLAGEKILVAGSGANDGLYTVSAVRALPNVTHNITVSEGLVTEAAGETVGVCKAGLTADTDWAVPREDWVAAGVIALAYKRSGHIMADSANQRLLRNEMEAVEEFRRLSRKNFKDPGWGFRPILNWGI